jgi:hypothetical protein
MTKITLITTEVDGSRKECVFEADYDVTWITLLDRFIDMLNGVGYIIDKEWIVIDKDSEEFTLADYVEG